MPTAASPLHDSAHTLVVFDFETTGCAPHLGDRSIEIGAVKLHQGQIVDSFSALMNPGIAVPAFIQQLTGISSAMLRTAAPNAQVMEAFYAFCQGYNRVAHNLAFDDKFLQAEWALIGRKSPSPSACSLLAARRLLPDAPSYSLSQLVAHLGLPVPAQYHRALADAQATSHLWLRLLAQLEQAGVTAPRFTQLQQLSKIPKQKIPQWLALQQGVAAASVRKKRPIHSKI
jgi:DNA polymerase III subunit epsilon